METSLREIRELLAQRAAEHLANTPHNRRAAERLQKAVLQLDATNANPLTRRNPVPAAVRLDLFALLADETDEFAQRVRQAAETYNKSC
jgi:hypothetical protein